MNWKRDLSYDSGPRIELGQPISKFLCKPDKRLLINNYPPRSPPSRIFIYSPSLTVQPTYLVGALHCEPDVCVITPFVRRKGCRHPPIVRVDCDVGRVAVRSWEAVLHKRPAIVRTVEEELPDPVRLVFGKPYASVVGIDCQVHRAAVWSRNVPFGYLSVGKVQYADSVSYEFCKPNHALSVVLSSRFVNAGRLQGIVAKLNITRLSSPPISTRKPKLSQSRVWVYVSGPRI